MPTQVIKATIHTDAKYNFELSANLPTSWATLCATASSTPATNAIENQAAYVGGAVYYLYRSMFSFDTTLSGIITSASLFIMPSALWEKDFTPTYAITLLEGTQTSATVLEAADCNNFGAERLATAVTIGNFTVNSYKEIPLNAAGLAVLNTAGYTKFCLTNENDFTVTAPANGHNPGVYFYSPSVTDKEPYLVITYEGSVSPSTSSSKSASWTPSASASITESASASITPSASESVSKSASPSETPAPPTAFTDLIHFFVKCTDGYTYGFGNTGNIYRRDTDAYWQKVYTDPDGEIKGAEEKPSSSGLSYLTWATDTKVKSKVIPGASNFSDTVTIAQNLISADWHTMKQVGGAVMICNKSWLAQYGYDDSFTNEALDLIPGNILKTIIERDGRAIIGCHNLTNSSKGINAMIEAEVPLSQVGSDGDIYFSNMADSIAAKRFPGGGKVNPGGVCNLIETVNFFEWDGDALSWIDKQGVGNIAMFAVWGADTGYNGIYTYGRKNKNKDFVLNLDYLLDADELGALCNVDGTVLVSYRDGTDYGVMAVDPAHKATGTYYGLDLKSPVKKPINITNWKYAEVFCDPLVLHQSITFWYRIDRGDWKNANMENGSGIFSAAGETKAVFFISEQGEIFEHKIILTPYVNTTPKINRVRIYFD